MLLWLLRCQYIYDIKHCLWYIFAFGIWLLLANLWLSYPSICLVPLDSASAFLVMLNKLPFFMNNITSTLSIGMLLKQMYQISLLQFGALFFLLLLLMRIWCMTTFLIVLNQTLFALVWQISVYHWDCKIWFWIQSCLFWHNSCDWPMFENACFWHLNWWTYLDVW